MKDTYLFISFLFLMGFQFVQAQEAFDKQPDSIHQTFFKNGMVLSEGAYIKNVKVVSWKYYYNSGELKSEGHFVNGKKEGEWINHYENGNLESFGNYKNDLKEGEWEFYAVNGPFLNYKFYHKGIVLED